MAVIEMVGRQLESPDIVDALLNIETTPNKPQYDPAPEHPLMLYECGFERL